MNLTSINSVSCLCSFIIIYCDKYLSGEWHNARKRDRAPPKKTYGRYEGKALKAKSGLKLRIIISNLMDVSNVIARKGSVSIFKALRKLVNSYKFLNSDLGVFDIAKLSKFWAFVKNFKALSFCFSKILIRFSILCFFKNQFSVWCNQNNADEM